MNSNLQKIFKRIFIIILIIYAIFINSTAISAASSRVTDENLFANNGFGEVQVTSVIEGGASDRAGMKVGDIILRINGQSFKNAGQADSILRAAKANSTMLYDIYRDGRELTLKVQAAQQEISLHQIASITMLLIVSLLVILLDFQKSKEVGIGLFSSAYLLIAIFFSLSINLVQSGLGNGQIFFILQFSFIFGMPLFTHSLLFLPRYKGKKKAERRIVFINYILCLAVLTLTIINPYSLGIGQLSLIANITYIIINLTNAILIALEAKNEVRKLRIYLISSLFLSIVGLVLFQVSSNAIFVFPSLLLLAFIFVPVTYYLFIRFRFFDILFVIKKNMQYQFAMNIFVLCSIFASLSIISLLSLIDLGDLVFKISPTKLEVLSVAQEGFSDRPVFIFAGILLSFIFIWFSKRFKHWLNHKYAREEYNYRKALTEFSGVIASQVRLEDLYQAIVSQTELFMPVKGVSLFVRVDNDYQLASLSGFSTTCRDKIYELEKLNLLDRLYSVAANSMSELKSFGIDELQVAVPLNIKNSTVGYLFLGEKKSEIAYSRSDFEFAESIAMQSAIAIENKKLTENARNTEKIREELELAKQLQIGLLPHEDPNYAELDVYGFYQAAGDVGGDYYDYFFDKDGDKVTHLTTVIGDVSGKGITASLYMTRFQGVMSSLFYSNDLSPKNLLSSTNRVVKRDIAKNSFVTCVVAEFNLKEKSLRYARAGHLPPIYYKAKTKSISEEMSSGIGLGIASDELFNKSLEEKELNLSKGDIIILVSDGVTEAMNANGEEFDTVGIGSVLKKHADKSAKVIGNELNKSINKFTQSDIPHDDITFIIAKVK